MAKLYEMAEEAEKVVLIAAATEDTKETEESLEELSDLAETAGAVVVGRVIQNRESVHPGTYIGKGKIEEVKALVEEMKADGVISDDELSPAQMKNLENELQCKVMDRTMLILDIFAQHARTGEGKLQVELAQQKYRQTRLIGMRSELSRLGGGIGTRGPGEKKLEMDRRLIKERIAQLNKELEGIKKSREVARSMRAKSVIPEIAIVGYTNAGKSTLLNYLTGAGVLEEDKLFATLDPTTKSLTLENGQQLLLTDTVGFIRKLPHHLIDAFRATLEEAKFADIILHVVDGTSPQCDQQMETVYRTLKQLDVTNKPVITAFNKNDLFDETAKQPVVKDLQAEETVWISAKTGNGMEQLLQAITRVLQKSKIFVEYVVPYTNAKPLAIFHKYGQVLEEEYREEGIYIKGYLPAKYALHPEENE